MNKVHTMRAIGASISIDEIIIEANRLIDTYGVELNSRVGPSLECMGFQASLSNLRGNVVTIPDRKFDPCYACGELLWYLRGSDDVSIMTPYSKKYATFANERGKADGAYGRRMTGVPPTVPRDPFCNLAALNEAYEDLQSNPTSRRCVVSLWETMDLWRGQHGSKDVPCTLNLQFLLREGMLHLIVTMRSNDVWLGMPYDIFCFTMIQRLMAEALGVGYGKYIHQVGSLHRYVCNPSLSACKAPKYETIYERNDSFPKGWESWHLYEALAAEEAARKGNYADWRGILLNLPSGILKGVAYMAGLRFAPYEFWPHYPKTDALSVTYLRKYGAPK